jgi:FAD/FMN-containing dehydrogenase
VCAIGDRYGLVLSNVFHAGDGNLHPNISFDRRDADELERVHAAGAEILKTCVEAGGVISGEHGIGTEKREYMGLLFSESDLDAMRRLQSVFDPEGVCNPGKVFPSTHSRLEADPRSRDDDRAPPPG